MSLFELEYWRGVYVAEFMGEQRADYRAALLRADVANFAGRALPDGRILQPLDGMPYIERPEPTVAEVEQKVDAAFALLASAQRKES